LLLPEATGCCESQCIWLLLNFIFTTLRKTPSKIQYQIHTRACIYQLFLVDLKKKTTTKKQITTTTTDYILKQKLCYSQGYSNGNEIQL
jgi:hypothetical protein